jgi:hypothetical protein
MIKYSSNYLPWWRRKFSQLEVKFQGSSWPGRTARAPTKRAHRVAKLKLFVNRDTDQIQAKEIIIKEEQHANIAS